MSIEVFDQIFPYINGVLDTNATKVSTAIKGTTQEVSTLVKNLAGFTPGPKMRETTIESLLPISGDGLEREGYFIRNTIVTLRLVNGGSGKTYESNAFITATSTESGVGETTKLTTTFVSEAKEFA